MVTAFNKYKGTMNAIIITDNRKAVFNPFDPASIKKFYARIFEHMVEKVTLSYKEGMTASVIATVLTGHFDNWFVSLKSMEGII